MKVLVWDIEFRLKALEEDQELKQSDVEKFEDFIEGLDNSEYDLEEIYGENDYRYKLYKLQCDDYLEVVGSIQKLEEELDEASISWEEQYYNLYTRG